MQAPASNAGEWTEPDRNNTMGNCSNPAMPANDSSSPEPHQGSPKHVSGDHTLSHTSSRPPQFSTNSGSGVESGTRTNSGNGTENGYPGTQTLGPNTSHGNGHSSSGLNYNPNSINDLPPPTVRPGSPSGSSVVSGVMTRRSDGSMNAHGMSGHGHSSAGGPGNYNRAHHSNPAVEETLLTHYSTLKRFLGVPYGVEVSSTKREATRSSRARDKLLRLSHAQVSELSQDVFDELLRRQAISGGPRGVPPPNHNIPPYLPPRSEFHDKRNQARQKLSSLQFQRFKDLAADVLCELERRYPNFSIADNPARARRQSPALSAASGFSNGRSSNGTGTGAFPPRSTSRARPPPPLAPNGAYAGEPGPHAHGYPGQSPSVGRFPPRRSSSSRNGSSHGPPPNGLGIMQSPGLPPGQGPPIMGAGIQGDNEFAPMAKSSQSNTIVPVKSTLVEEDSVDDEAETEVQEQQGDTARTSHVSAASKDHGSSHDRISQPQNTDGQAAKAEEGSQSTAQVAQLTALVERLKAEIATHEEEKKRQETQQQDHDDMQQKVADAETMHQALEVEHEALKRVHEEQKEQVNRVKDLEAEKTKWDESRLELEHQLLELQERNNELFADIERLQADHEYHLEHTAQERTEEKKEWDEEKEILLAKIVQAESQNEEVQERLVALQLKQEAQSGKSAQREPGSANEEEWERLTQSLQAKLNEAEQQRQDLYEELEHLKQVHEHHLDNQDEHHHDSQGEKGEWNEVLADLEQKLEIAEGMKKELKDELTVQLRENEEQQNEHQREQEELRNRYEALQNEHVILQNKHLEQSENLRELELAMEGQASGGGGEWKEKYEALASEHAELQEKFSDCLAVEVELRRRLDEQGKHDEALDRRCETLEKECNELEKTLHDQLAVQTMLKQQLADSANMKQETEEHSEWKLRFEDLEKKHEALQNELRAQQEVTEQVREQAQAFLAEMRELSEQGGGNLEREEALSKEIQSLEEEVRIWKDRYAKTRTRLRGLRSSTLGLPGMEFSVHLFKEHDLLVPDGLVTDVHVTKFQMGIDELLRTARMGEPQLVLEKVKSVVTAVRALNQDLEKAAFRMTNQRQDALSPPPTSSAPSSLSPTTRKLKNRVASTANNLITATKNYSRSNGLSPVSLLDAAASHLSSAVVELVRNVKIRPTPVDELADEEEDGVERALQSPGMFSVAQSQGTRFSRGSLHSAFGTPSQTGSGMPMGDMAANVSRMLSEHQKKEVEKELEKERERQRIPSGAEAFPRQPSVADSTSSLTRQGSDSSSTRQAPKQSPELAEPESQPQHSQHSQSAPVEEDEELEDLRMYVDDQAVNFLNSAEALVTHVRTSSPSLGNSEKQYQPSVLREHLDTITAIIEHVSMATEQILTSPTPSPVNTKLRSDIYGRVAGIIEHLTGEREELLISAHKLNPSDPGYSQAAARVEQVAYQLGSNLKYLVSRLDPEPEPEPDHPSDARAATAGHNVNQQNQLPSSPRRPEAHDSDANEHSDADSVYDEADVYEYGEKAEVASVATPVRARSLYNKGASPPI